MNILKKLAPLAFALLLASPVLAAEVATSTIVKLEKDTPQCKIHCVDAHPSCEESAQVIDILKQLFQAYYNGDVDFVSKYIADDCTGFDDDHKLTVGKAAILDHIRKHIEKNKSDDSPLQSYTISSPYAQINGDTAIVTFLALKDYGGVHPHRLVSHSTDIFVKRDGQWIKLHYRNSWKPAPMVSTADLPAAKPQ